MYSYLLQVNNKENETETANKPVVEASDSVPDGKELTKSAKKKKNKDEGTPSTDKTPQKPSAEIKTENSPDGKELSKSAKKKKNKNKDTENKGDAPAPSATKTPQKQGDESKTPPTQNPNFQNILYI